VRGESTEGLQYLRIGTDLLPIPADLNLCGTDVVLETHKGDLVSNATYWR
jgi:hypothetical protein